MDGQLKRRPTAGRVVPREDARRKDRWEEAFAKFAAAYKGVPLSVRIIEPNGRARALEGSANVELRLMSIGEEMRNGERVVVLFVHKYPGAQITQIEFSDAVRLEQDRAKLTVAAADGYRFEVQASGRMGAMRE